MIKNHVTMAQLTIVKTTKDYMLVKIPMPPRGPVSPVRGLDTRKRELTARGVRRIVAEGERAYRRGKIGPIRSMRELMR